jgi:hypothetical protein
VAVVPAAGQPVLGLQEEKVSKPPNTRQRLQKYILFFISYGLARRNQYGENIKNENRIMFSDNNFILSN